MTGRLAWAGLLVIVLLSLLAGALAPHSYEEQFREAIQAGPSREFPLGTDALGRDRLARLLHGSRVSLTLAPLAALLTTLLAGLLGGLSGYWGGRGERALLLLTDLFLSLPWLFLLLALRGALPLEVSPLASLTITFLVLGLLGWAGPARIVRSGIRSLLESDFVLQAQANGVAQGRILWRHLLPNVWPLLAAQFLLAVPLFVLSEANLGLLGLGVAEPLPSWGGLLKELENYQSALANPWCFAPVGLLIVVVSCLQILSRRDEAA